MILVDSSVWIEHFFGNQSKQTEILHDPLGVRPGAIGDLILTEVLQGFRRDKDYETAKPLFDDLTVFPLLGKAMALKSADNFRALRKKSITVRKTADMIIASFVSKATPPAFYRQEFQTLRPRRGLRAGGSRANMTHLMMTDPADMPRFYPAQAGASYSALWMMPGPSMDVNYEVLGKEGKLSLEEAIKAATINNAWLMNKENELGSIEAGKSADFVVLEKNLFDVAEHEIGKVTVEGTYYKGGQTYSGE